LEQLESAILGLTPEERHELLGDERDGLTEEQQAEVKVARTTPTALNRGGRPRG
jgi:hypothetical protein